jgi:hypothetical protein
MGVSNNTGGAIYNEANADNSSLTISNSTFSGNTARSGGAIANKASGGNSSYIANTVITNSTIVQNNAEADSGGVYATNTGSNETSTISLSNSILYGNTATGGENCASSNIGASIVVNNNNLLSSSATDCNPGASDVTTTAPHSSIIGDLANNGGSTPTHALVSGSPAIDAGNDATCAATPVNNISQNGVIRPQETHCDIGAFEKPDTTSPTISSSVRVNPDPTSLDAVQFTVTFSESVTGVNASDFTLTTTGVSVAAVSGVSGSGTTYTVTVDTGVGSGTIRLDLIDNDSIQDTSLNPLGGTGAGNGNFITGQSYTVNKSPVFEDVPYSYWANVSIERLYDAGITGGCSPAPLNYCPENLVTRDQMAIFLERGMHGSSFSPPNVIPTFNDTDGNFAEDWIEALKNDGITGGCGTNIYCPSQGVTRAQMAIFLERAMHGASFVPPDVSPTFSDTAGHFAEDWIEALKNDGITTGCGTGIYCPDAIVTRAQMAVFLVKAFGLP